MERMVDGLAAQLESIVDRRTLREVLEALAVVCDEKADHIKANWQDANHARLWSQASRAIRKAKGNTAV